MQAIDSSSLPKKWGEPMDAPAIFEQQIEIKLLHPASLANVMMDNLGKRMMGIWAVTKKGNCSLAAPRFSHL
ncbi:MAG: hypothetical protein P8X74_13650 [Reinekea sp.]